MKQLTEKEEEVMRKLWTRDEVTARELLEMYPEPRPNFNTIATFLRILENKGWVKHRAISKVHLYRAALTQEEMGRKSVKSIAGKFFNGSLAGMVSSLLKDEELTEEQLRELKEIVNKNSTD